MKHFDQIIAALMCCALMTSAQLAGQSTATHPSATPTYRYMAIDLGTLGGPSSYSCVPDCRYLNNAGETLFDADTAAPDPFPSYCLIDCYAPLGVKYVNGKDTILSSLPGGVDTRPVWFSDSGLVSGYAENGLLDPSTGQPEIVAVLWHGGTPQELGTFGGTASLGWAVNDSGQVAGGAATTTPDALAGSFWDVDPFPFLGTTEIHAFLWNDGALHDLGTLGGPDSNAQFLNDSGQVAGISFTNSTPNSTTGLPTLDPFLWENGKMKDLGSLGGTLGYPYSINNAGHVVGQSNLAGDTTYQAFLWKGDKMIALPTLGGNNGLSLQINDADAAVGWGDLPGSQAHHATLWRNGKVTDLGVIGTDPCSTGYSINASGQVVGDSGDGSGIETCGPKLHGFLWENGGPAVDISTLFAPLSSGLNFFAACCIADGGEILGIGSLPNGDDHMMLIVPCDANHVDAPACHAGAGELVGADEASQAPRIEPSTVASWTHNRAQIHKPALE
jgi:probable HAF family extracellular repeat protein